MKRSQVKEVPLMGIIKLRVRLKTGMKQKKKKKWMTVPTRQKRNQPQRPNQMKTLTQIKMSLAGKGRRPNFGRGPDYRNRTRLISDCSESVLIYGPLLPFPMLIIPLPIQSEPSTFQCAIMRLSDDMKYDRCIETCHERT